MRAGELYLVRPADGLRVFKPIDELADALAEVDADHPLPHPGYRPGQVWRLSFRQVSMEDVLSWPAGNQPRGFGNLIAEDAAQRLNPILSYQRHRAGHNTAIHPSAFDHAHVPVFRFGGVDLIRDAFDQLFDAPLADVTPTLLADPCCPHLAPWSPAVLDKTSRSLDAVQTAWSCRTFGGVSEKAPEEVP